MFKRITPFTFVSEPVNKMFTNVSFRGRRKNSFEPAR